MFLQNIIILVANLYMNNCQIKIGLIVIVFYSMEYMSFLGFTPVIFFLFTPVKKLFSEYPLNRPFKNQNLWRKKNCFLNGLLEVFQKKKLTTGKPIFLQEINPKMTYITGVKTLLIHKNIYIKWNLIKPQNIKTVTNIQWRSQEFYKAWAKK